MGSKRYEKKEGEKLSNSVHGKKSQASLDFEALLSWASINPKINSGKRT